MAQTASSVAQQQAAALDTILEVLARHDSDASERIQTLFVRGARKWSVRAGAVDSKDEMLLILAEAVASLAKLAETQRAEADTPRPRGRPPKARDEQEAS
jgi:hypothetical protein